MIREIGATQPQPRAVLIDLGASGDLDIPTMDVIADVAVKLRARSVTLMFAQVRGAVRDRLARAHVLEIIGPENIHFSLAVGVDAYRQRHAIATSADSNVDHARLLTRKDARRCVAERPQPSLATP